MYDFFDQKLRFKKPPVMVFDSEPSNQSNVLGKTAYYDPESLEIHIYTDGRHPKDMLRSIAHELIHHKQNMDDRLDVGGYNGPGYYLENDKLRVIEHEAMLEGNKLMREYEDTIKKENKNMSLKEWKNNELNKLLLQKFGILNEKKEITHMCALEVTHKKSGEKGHPIKHTLTESGDISHYTVEFKNVIVENIAVENLDIIVQEEHTHKRDDEKDHDKKKPVVEEDYLNTKGADEELSQAKKRNSIKDDEINEADKPDFPDVDGDGDREESISKAQQDKKDGDSGDEKEDESKKCPKCDKSPCECDKEESEDKDLSKVPPQLRDHVKGKMKESRVNLKQLVEKVLKNNEKIMKKLKDK
jgi:hypothetical protein